LLIEDFNTLMQGKTLPVVVDLWAEWCGPCRTIKPVLERLAHEYAGRVELMPLDASAEPGLVRELGVMAIPTLLIYQGGRQTGRITGAKTADTYAAMFASLAAGVVGYKAVPSSAERLFRVGVAILVGGLGVFTASWVLVLLGALVFFSAVYDRCPIWQALTGWWKRRKDQTRA
jgi:thioredoxin 1